MSLDVIQIPWADRWLGGFCPLGALDGLPVRAADYAAHPPLAETLRLPTASYPPTTLATALEAWSAWCGGAEVALVCHVDRAWRLLLCAAEVEEGEVVGVPANASSGLVEAIKQYGAIPRFLPLDAQLKIIDQPLSGVKWAQSVSGLPTGGSTWQDYHDSFPLPAPPSAEVAVFGLHLSKEASQAGALIVFKNPVLARALKTRLLPSDLPSPHLALAQLNRLKQFYPLYQARLAETWQGLAQAAALPMLTLADEGAIPQGVAVQIPLEADVATFYSYLKQENTPIQWLPEIRPLHYAAVREKGCHAISAAHLARWLLVPVGYDYTSEEIKQAVLGVVKASEYLGVRWRTQPQKALEYAELLTQMYGTNHDAYRPVFEVPA